MSHEDCARELRKLIAVAWDAERALWAHAEFNARLHCATEVIPSTLHKRLVDAAREAERAVERMSALGNGKGLTQGVHLTWSEAADIAAAEMVRVEATRTALAEREAAGPDGETGGPT